MNHFLHTLFDNVTYLYLLVPKSLLCSIMLLLNIQILQLPSLDKLEREELKEDFHPSPLFYDCTVTSKGNVCTRCSLCYLLHVSVKFGRKSL